MQIKRKLKICSIFLFLFKKYSYQKLLKIIYVIKDLISRTNLHDNVSSTLKSNRPETFEFVLWFKIISISVWMSAVFRLHALMKD